MLTLTGVHNYWTKNIVVFRIENVVTVVRPHTFSEHSTQRN